MGKSKRSPPKFPPPPLIPCLTRSLPADPPSLSSSSGEAISPDSAPAIAQAVLPSPKLADTMTQVLSPAAGEPGSTVQLQVTSDVVCDTQLAQERDTLAASTSQVKPKWIDLIKGPSTKMRRKGTPFLLESGEKCVRIPNEVIQRNHRRWDAFIVGQFHGNLPSHGALHAIFKGIWSNRTRDITVSMLGSRTVLIQIPNASSRARVLSQGMWLIEGQTMFVAEWAPGLTPVLPELTKVPVWMEFREAPLHFFSEEGLEHIAGLVGDLVCCHPSTLNMTNLKVAKVLTILDPTKEIPEAVNAQFGSGEISRVKVSCLWLPPICKHCQGMGHNIRHCPTAPITCVGCNSSSHSAEGCPPNRSKLDKGEGTSTSKKAQGTGKGSGKQKNKTTKAKGNPTGQEKESLPPLIRDIRKGKGKVLSCFGMKTRIWRRIMLKPQNFTI